MKLDLMIDNHIVNAITPVADAFAGGVTSDVIFLRDYAKIGFFVHTGAIEDANISNLVTLLAADDATPTNTQAIPFYWRSVQASATVEQWTALTFSAATGYNFATNNAVANALWYLEASAEEIWQGGITGSFDAVAVQLSIAETANKTITASAIAVLQGANYAGARPAAALA